MTTFGPLSYTDLRAESARAYRRRLVELACLAASVAMGLWGLLGTVAP